MQWMAHCALEGSRRRPSQPLHPSQIERQTHQIPLASNCVPTADAELPKAQRLFGPAEDRLGDEFAPPVVILALGRGQALSHALRRRESVCGAVRCSGHSQPRDAAREVRR